MKEKINNLKWYLYTSTIVLFLLFLILPIVTKMRVDVNQHYESKEEVALYILKYDKLPLNFITKTQAESFYQSHIDAVEAGFNIGGDIFRYEGSIVNFTDNTSLIECDIYSNRETRIDQNNRGTHRIVFSSDGEEVFYTSDHYETFSKITYFQIQSTSILLWLVLVIYVALTMALYSTIIKRKYIDKNTLLNDVKIILINSLKGIFLVPILLLIYASQYPFKAIKNKKMTNN